MKRVSFLVLLAAVDLAMPALRAGTVALTAQSTKFAAEQVSA